MIKRICQIALVSLLPVMAIAQTTQPSSSIADSEAQATKAFKAGQYATALPMLEKVAVAYKSQPDKVAPILDMVRVCQKQLDLPQVGSGPATQASLSAGRKPHVPPPPGQVLDFPSIKDLGNFDYDAEKGGNIPKDVLALTGSKIRLRGFMIPLDQAENISQFALVPSLFACCFGQPPSIQHTVVVHCPPGKAVAYYPDEISVEGTLKVEEKKDDGFIVSVFEMDASSVKPAAK